ncbi:unnamed protein product [Orchesella dallaii]|uniref:Protein polybromo-1 n=1 Tax=Orchesella dallaii TaxID=48710 RepID=A0ABP1PKX1_9HEXA
MSSASATVKRRRTSMSSSASVASREDDAGSVDLDYQPETKRKKIVRLDPIEQCQQLYDIIRNNKKEDGVLLCEAFIRVPKRRQEPAYYEVVSNPMDMIRIQQKIKMDEYEDIEQMSADVDLMVANAKAFYKRSTQEYKDAGDLWDLFIESKLRLFDRDSPTEDCERKGKIILKMGKLARRAAAVEARKPTIGEDGETSESSSTTDRHDDLDKGDSILLDNLEELFSAVMVAKDVDDRPLHNVFQLLPSRKQYPNYYEIIENPIDLKMIAIRIQGGEYASLNDLERDLVTMFRNACTFNEPGSQIYKDAKTLKRIVSARRVELENRKQTGYTPGKTSERIRNRRLRSGLSHSAITAALQYEDDSEEDAQEIDEEEMEVDEEVEEEEEDAEEAYDGDLEDPMWLLLEHITNYTSSSGTLLSDPFKRLPSRRFYSDYYKEIKNPISLSQIRNKIQRGEYDNLTQVQADMNIMFENAKHYNRPDSKLYKTACKLQKGMQVKVQELLDQEDGVSSNGEEPEPVKRNINTTPLPTLVMEGAAEIVPQNIVPDKPPGLEIAAPPPMPVPPIVPVKTQPSPKKVKSNKSGRDSSGSSSGVNTSQLMVSTKSNPHKFAENEDRNPKAVAVREEIKKRLRLLYGTLVDYQEADGRCPISMFMEKPSRKQYPQYYNVIVEPIDMLTIKASIDFDKYNGTDELVRDFRLMFNNCRQFNEEGSIIYDDANKLEQVLNDKLRVIGPDPSLKAKKKKKRNPALLQKQKKLLETVKEYRDKNGRHLSVIFQKLPSKAEYPQYYDVIKSPIDLEKICNKQRNGTYESMDHIANDFMQMFDNACKFNEPDSQIYKDALVLQRLLLQTKLTISSEDGTPDVPCAVREILTSIFTSVYNHHDEEGRCYSDTMAELPEFDEIESQKKRAISLDLIKHRLDRGFYKRLDVFQKDMFLCFERARKLSRTDSQLFEDSIELHSFFIKTRDEICGKGAVLQSPALDYGLMDLEKFVEAIRAEKREKEAPQEEDLGLVEVKKEENYAALAAQTESYNNQVYCVGDFVYVGQSYNADTSSSDGSSGGAGGANSKPAVKPNIANIQKLWTAPDGTKMFEGIWFFRPDQTYHLPTRKFLQKEVFRSEVRSTAMLSEIVGKCYVMTVKGKEYFNCAPEGFADDDVYVCEYRYSSRGRSFTKLKSWAFGSIRVRLVSRPKPLEPIRIASVFRERVENQKEDFLRIDDEVEKAPKEEFSNIPSPLALPGKDNQTFYEQFNLSFGPVRMGDYVYVRVENGKKLVARIDSMWTDSSGTAYFHGPWFTSLSEVCQTTIPVGRTFFQQEIFQSSIEDTNPLLSVCGKCCVLDVDDFKKRRPTEIPENDVFVCECLYDEARREIRVFEGLKKIYCKDSGVHRDEIYFFRKPITMIRVDVEGVIIQDMPKLKTSTKMGPMSPAVIPKIESDNLTEDSMDFSPPSIGSSDSHSIPPIVNTPVVVSTPVATTPSTKKAKTPGKKLVTGYILYSSEVRKSVAEKNPDKGFGEISRMVGTDWRKMGLEDKQKYEERAAKINEQKEIAARAAAAEAKAAAETAAAIAAQNQGPDSPAPAPPTPSTPVTSKGKDASKETDMVAATAALKKDPDWIFECCWDGCDWQFEDALDLIEHCVQEPKGHVPTYFKDQNPNEGEFQCHWKNCTRVKKGVNPFPTLSRLLKHVKDIHVMKGNGRIIHPDMRSKNIQLSRTTLANKAAESAAPSSSAAAAQPTVQAPSRPAPPPEPLFVAVPPRPQKLLHSEAYIRYIESLHAKKRKMTDWEKTLKATKETTKVPDESKLPRHWLANGAGPHGSVTNALWALRDFMMRDALNLHKVNN